MTFHIHTLLQEYSWGTKQGRDIVTCNTENLVLIGLVCVFLTALYFRVTYCSHLQRLYSIHASALHSQVYQGDMGKLRHLHEWGISCEGEAMSCHVKCIYSKFLDFFPVWREHSVNHGRLCTGEDVCQMCGHRPLLHQSTRGLAQEWSPPR